MRKKDIFIVLVGFLLIIAAGVVAVMLAMQAAGGVRNEMYTLYGEHLKLLADKSQVLVRRSDMEGLERLLRDYAADGIFIQYAFVQSGGRPYVHTFGGEFPSDLISTRSDELTREPSVVMVTLPSGGSYYDMAMLIGIGNASLHIGVPANRIDQFGIQSVGLPFVLIGIGILGAALFSAVIVVATLRRARPAMPKPIARPAASNAPWQEWATIVENVPAGIFVVDPRDGRIGFANGYAAHMIGLSKGMIIGGNVELYFASAERGDLPLAEVTDDQENKRGLLVTHSNGKVPVARYATPVSFQGREQTLVTFFDITDMKDMQDRLRQAFVQQESLANYDKLTRLFNRRAIQRHAEAEINRAERGSALSFAMMDIDHFKKINDTHGHNIGDQVLKRVAEAVRHTIRPYDWAGRWGGEEFMVILPGTPLEEAGIAAERIRVAIESAQVHLKGYRELSVTVSLGITSTGLHSNNTHQLDELVHQADEALYHAKASGRNCIGVFRNGQLEIFKPEQG